MRRSAAKVACLTVFCIYVLPLISATIASNSGNASISELVEGANGTLPADVDVLNDLISSFGEANLPGNSTGDPCARPTWNWIQCSNTNPARIVGVFLSNQNLQHAVIPASIANLTELTYLNITMSHISGQIPDLSPLVNLQILNLYWNNLNGSIPSDMFRNLTNLRALSLAQNNLDGTIPDTIFQLTKLQTLYLDKNNLSGEIPDLIALQQLQQLKFSYNNLGGLVPNSLSQLKSLQWLWLDNNPLLVGPLPDVSGLSNLQRLYVFNCSSFNGSMPDVSNLTYLFEMFMDHNQLSGQIPQLSNLPSLQSLGIENNNLDGPIPESLANLGPNLRNLLLGVNVQTIHEEPCSMTVRSSMQHNRFTSIPSDLVARSNTGSLNLQFDHYLSSNVTEHVTGAGHGHIVGLIIGISVAAVGCLGVLATLLILYIRKTRRVWSRKINPKDRPTAGPRVGLEVTELEKLEFGPRKFTLNELSTATKGFSGKEVLGRGGFGYVYKGVLEDTGTAVAVKKISQTSKQGAREFMAEVKIIGRLRHRHLVPLLGWCYEEEELLLVYEFMPNGSLDKILFVDKDEPTPVLSWELRFNILCGVAKALLFLHEEWDQRVVHRDVKASNVMLDSGFSPRLGDFGLARLYEHSNQAPDSTFMAGTWGYVAPECTPMFRSKVTDKTDVYSFGAVALEVACGRKVMDVDALTMDFMLQDWVWALYKDDKILDAVDSRLYMCEAPYDESQMNIVLRVGLLCSHPNPAARPHMRQVLRFLTGEATVPEVPRVKPVPTFAPQLGDHNLDDAKHNGPDVTVKYSDLVMKLPATPVNSQVQQVNPTKSSSSRD